MIIRMRMMMIMRLHMKTGMRIRVNQRNAGQNEATIVGRNEANTAYENGSQHGVAHADNNVKR